MCTQTCTQDRADVLLADVKEQFVELTKQNCAMIESVIINPFWKQESQIDHQGLRRNVRLPHISLFHVHMCDEGEECWTLAACVRARVCAVCVLLTKTVMHSIIYAPEHCPETLKSPKSETGVSNLMARLFI